ncbi:MAG: RDD family protein, partial [bacterium]
MTARPFEQTVDVETPEMVVLTYSLAGVGSRVLAAITDLFICMGTLFAVFVAVVMLGGGASALRFEWGASWGLAVLLLAQFVVVWGYYVLFEGLMDGQTPGKRIHR